MSQGFDTIVGNNVKIKGNLSNQGSIEIHGVIEGEVSSEEDILVGESAQLNGPIKAKNIDVSGSIIGSLIALEKLELQATSKVEGDITASILSIKPGATFKGTCNIENNSGNRKSKQKFNLEVEE